MIQDAVSVGDIHRGAWPASQSGHVNLYMGSGSAGACFDSWGLMHNAPPGEKHESISDTVLSHADHWHRGKWGLDYWMPVCRLMWAGKEPAAPASATQTQRLYDGDLTTTLNWPGLRWQTRSYFHPYRRDLLAVEIDYDADGPTTPPPLLLKPQTRAITSYGDEVTGRGTTLQLTASSWTSRVRMGSADSTVVLRTLSEEGSIELTNDGDGVRIAFKGPRGKHLLLIGIAGTSRADALSADVNAVTNRSAYAAEAKSAWRRRWGDAYIVVPDRNVQAMWARSLYYVLASYAPEVRAPAAPMGWAGNSWNFHFPQDVSYIHPALLRLGHIDIAKAIVEFYRQHIDNTLKTTRRLYGVDGAMWAWEHPIGPDAHILPDGTPNHFQFEIHNGAYPARMARETSLYLNDAKWTREIAWPIVRESARFYGTVATKEANGKHSIHVIPSMGQDEMGGEDAKNYLDALYSAEYTLKTAVAMADELGLSDPAIGTWREIVKGGMAFDRLRDPRTGLLATCEGLAGAKQMGKAKHPVQLNPLIFLPPLGAVQEEVHRAYRQRQALCAGVPENHYHGWTLAAFWLAASREGDGEGLAHELSQSIKGQYVDRDWIQIYETSAATHAPFYVTSHGLYLQALNDAAFSDYLGEPRTFAAWPASWKSGSFTNLRTIRGQAVSDTR